jgi:type I restriction enzyme S subunit
MKATTTQSSVLACEDSPTDVPSGYKRTEAGVIPMDWEVRMLGRVADLRNGYAFKSRTYVAGGKYRVITIANVQDGRLGLDSFNAINALPRDLQEHQRLRIGDLLVSMTGNVGRACAVDEEDCLLNQRVGKLTPKGIDPSYLYYLAHDRRFLLTMIERAVGGAQGNLGKSDIIEYRCLLPASQNEQRAIAEALSDVDELIEALAKLIAKKRAIKQAAMQQLLKGNTRLPGFTGEWETKWLGDVARIKTGSRNNEDKVGDGEYPFFVRSEVVERINSYSHDCEAILVPGEGRIGSIFHYIHGRFDVHQRVYAITQFQPGISAKFVHFYMSKNFGAWAMQNTVKATVDSLRLPTFQAFEMRMPPTLDEQTAIATALRDMDAEIEVLERRRDKTKQIKQGMMQELLTGRIRLIKGES